MREFINKIKEKLSKLSFRTGVVVLLCCIPFYILSFAQMSLNIDFSLKSVLFVIFFGLAKTFQYGGLTILGAKGLQRLKDWWRIKRLQSQNNEN